ncbi:SNF2 family helicase [Spironucleus salmonicida]|uniref:SNF2 family helicase n=1 Tax=Spironucleus salmonicida TaxID=348837 RepID=V6LQX4_9EUKA|nr:SNF2 family helicase [Spironucleus salmonicida]|eukprot:EST46648.1 SNF2 family helicase [Spironucleus salmonicida]
MSVQTKLLELVNQQANSLFSYQKQTVNFINISFSNHQTFQKYSLNMANQLNFAPSGVLIGHEPGLGKTVIISHFLYIQFANCQIKKALIIAPKSLIIQWKQHILTWCNNVNVLILDGSAKQKLDILANASKFTQLIIISSYQSVIRNFNLLVSLKFDILVADEATELKNTNSQNFKHLTQFPHQAFKIALTGTPIMNSLTELFAIVQFAVPNFFGDQKQFQKHYIKNIEKNPPDQLSMECERRIAEKLAEIMLRFTKNQIKSKLTNKQEIIVWANLPNRVEYQNQIENKNQDHVFSQIQKLKICTETQKLAIIIKMASFFATKHLKTLIFAENISTLKTLQASLNSLLITGEIPSLQRDALQQRFQSDKDVFICVLSMKIGALGLNLQAAQRVIIVSPHWNPQIEEQAVARAWRLGGKSEVIVYKMVFRACIDEKIVQRQLFKRGLTQVIGGKELFQVDGDLYDVLEQKSCGLEIESVNGDLDLLKILKDEFKEINIQFGEILAQNEVIHEKLVKNSFGNENISKFIALPTIDELRRQDKMNRPIIIDVSQTQTELDSIFGESDINLGLELAREDSTKQYPIEQEKLLVHRFLSTDQTVRNDSNEVDKNQTDDEFDELSIHDIQEVQGQQRTQLMDLLDQMDSSEF